MYPSLFAWNISLIQADSLCILDVDVHLISLVGRALDYPVIGWLLIRSSCKMIFICGNWLHTLSPVIICLLPMIQISCGISCQSLASDFFTQNLGPNIGVFTILKMGKNSQKNEENSQFQWLTNWFLWIKSTLWTCFQ